MNSDARGLWQINSTPLRKLWTEDCVAVMTIPAKVHAVEYMRCFNCGQGFGTLVPFIIRALLDGRIVLLHRNRCENNPYAFTEVKDALWEPLDDVTE